MAIKTSWISGRTSSRKSRSPEAGFINLCEVDWVQVEELAAIHCTPSEISAVVRVHEKDLVEDGRFTRAYQRGQERGRMSVRRMQILKAREGNVQMLMFLGKQILGQRDVWQGSLAGVAGGSPLQVEDVTTAGLNRLSVEELRLLDALISKVNEVKPLPVVDSTVPAPIIDE